MSNSRKQKKRNVYILLALVLVLTGISLAAPYLIPNDPYETNALFAKAAPSAQFPFGTDKLGRCVFSRVLMGAKTSIFSALILVVITMVVGTALGTIAGYYGGIVDGVIMRIADIFLSFPQMVFAIAVAGVMGGTMINAMIALGLTGWTLFARLARGRVMALKEEEFVQAAKLTGNNSARIMRVYLLPNYIGEMVVNASIQIGTTMLGFAGLSFLGLGVQVPQAEWGSMISEARGYLQLAPWAVIAPGIALFITVSVFNLLGDALSEYFEVGGNVHE
ncbi:MAG: ABC transporter permease [bacterium]|nr:ABC transporter permease [bacterium]